MDKISQKEKENITTYLNFMPELLKKDEIINYLQDIHYFTAPSSFDKHGAWIGGNFDHSMKVTELLLEYTEENDIQWSRTESPYIIGMFHDLCKSDIRTFEITDDDNYIIKANDFADMRHSEKSLELLRKYVIDLTVEEKMCIYYHMGEHGEDFEYRMLMEKMMLVFPNIEYVQKADTAAADMGI